MHIYKVKGEGGGGGRSYVGSEQCHFSRYVLLHYLMGGFDGAKTWCFVEGGMGGVSMAIAKAAQLYGADLYTEKVRGMLHL